MPNQLPPLIDKEEAEKEIVEAQQTLSFDIKEFPVETHVQKLAKGDYVIPEYQRNFTWNKAKQSKFIESVLIGIPVPYLFGVEDPKQGTIQIIDGCQRLNSLRAFYNGSLVLTDLEKLDGINGFKFHDLSPLQQRRFQHRTIRMIVIAAADLVTQFEIFERINTTPETPTPAEIRRGAFPGPITNLLIECAKDPRFEELTPQGERQTLKRSREELVLRLFAYAHSYKEFKHDVSRFLDDYLRSANQAAIADPNLAGEHRDLFERVVSFAARFFKPHGFASPGKKQTPNVRFEALAVGAALAIAERPNLTPQRLGWIVDDEEFRQLTRTDASNSGPRLRSRIEYVRDKLLDRR
jgi:hypothetical protein